jgi:hypothetical protein
VTRVYAARDREHNDAVVLADVVRHGLPRSDTPRPFTTGPEGPA